MREEEKDEGGGKEEGKEVGRRQNKKQMAIDVCLCRGAEGYVGRCVIGRALGKWEVCMGRSCDEVQCVGRCIAYLITFSRLAATLRTYM